MNGFIILTLKKEIALEPAQGRLLAMKEEWHK
jgi:hypothetical protein